MSHQFNVHDISTLGSQGININDQQLLEVAEADLGLMRREVVSTEQAPFHLGTNQINHEHINAHKANDWASFRAPSDEDAKKLSAMNNGQSHRARLTAELTQTGGSNKFSGRSKGIPASKRGGLNPSSVPFIERGVGKLRTKISKIPSKITVARINATHGLNLATDAEAFMKATNLIFRTGPVTVSSSSKAVTTAKEPVGLAHSKWADTKNVAEEVGVDTDDSDMGVTLKDPVDSNNSPQLISIEEDGMMEALIQTLDVEIARLRISQYKTDLEDLEMSDWEAPPMLDSGCFSLLHFGDGLSSETMHVREPANDSIVGHAQAENLQVRDPVSKEITGNVTATPDRTGILLRTSGNVRGAGMMASRYAPGNVKAATAVTGILASRSGNVLGTGMMASIYAPGNSHKQTFGVRRR